MVREYETMRVLETIIGLALVAMPIWGTWAYFLITGEILR